MSQEQVGEDTTQYEVLVQSFRNSLDPQHRFDFDQLCTAARELVAEAYAEGFSMGEQAIWEDA
jgi:hypothetical protein